MTTAITWIHLSDFHAGGKGRAAWDQVETELRPSVQAMVKRLGVPDLILFTGDLANRGEEDEYAQVDRLLDLFNDWVGHELPVVAVPGNHDVVRSWRHAALKNYEDEPSLREALWKGTDPVLDDVFPHYVAWAKRRVIGSLKKAGWEPHVSSRVPGDLSLVADKDGFRLGLVGLNTAWTHLSDGVQGKLLLPTEQFHAALPEGLGNPLKWFDDLHAAFLLTHHPYEWLSKRSREAYLAEIHPPGRFALALFGHVHESRALEVTISGGKPRAFAQATSLFGLEHYGEKNEKRVIGYSWGRITVEGEVRVWPLARVNRGSGGYVFDRDQRFDEQDDELGGTVLVHGRTPGSKELSPAPRAVEASEPASSPVFADELRGYEAKIVALHHELLLAGFETKVRVPVDLEDLYVPLDAGMDRGGKRRQVFHGDEHAERHETEIPLAQAFEAALHRGKKGMRGVVLLGDPGSGKTTHLKQVLLKVVRDGSASIGLPEGIVPVFLPLRRLRDLDAGLSGFIQQELHDPVLGVPERFGERLCKRGQLLFLLDGLDEVADADHRRRVARWIEHALRAQPSNYFLVSCRFSGYTLDCQLDEHFLELGLRPMSPDKVETFVRRWYRIVERALADDEVQADLAAEARANDLLETLRKPAMSSSRVYTMTHNPLLLTTICLVHRDRGRLPDERVLLYEEAVSVLLERWRMVTKELKVRFPGREARQVLQPVAWWMHQAPGRIRASSAELEEPVTQGLLAIGEAVKARVFLETIRDESGLLTGWGVDEFGFMHLGFQEHLAARAVQARVLEEPELLSWLAERFDDGWWQEVILLMLAQDHPPMFKPFMSELVKRKEFPEWSRSALMEMCWNEAFGASREPFVAVLRAGTGVALEQRQLAAAELLVRRMPGELEVLDEQEGLLRAHPSAVVRQWWKARVLREAALETIVAPRGGVELVRIPAGRFLMGSPGNDEGAYDDETPQRDVQIESFYFARTPVTNAQYRQYLRANPGVQEPKFWGDRKYNQDEQPVVGVSWHEAQAYCEWAGLSLPTEAQWEYACRADTTARYYSGDDEGALGRVGWYNGNSGGRLHVVGQLEPNPWGLYDMHGNIWEWCENLKVSDVQSIFQIYIAHVTHSIKREWLYDASGKVIGPDEVVMAGFERVMGVFVDHEEHVTESMRRRARAGMLTPIGAWALSHPNVEPHYAEIFPDYFTRLSRSHEENGDRVARGGSFQSAPRLARSACRYHAKSSARMEIFGFRPAIVERLLTRERF